MKRITVFHDIIQLWDIEKVLDIKWLKNWHFLWLIATLDEADFEIKVADRLDNLDDLEYVDIDYIKKNIESTRIYIKTAKALYRPDLAALLQEGIQKLETRKQELENPTSLAPRSVPSAQ